MRVVTVCEYLAAEYSAYSQEQWDAFKLVRAVKGIPFKGYANVPNLGHLSYENADKGMTWAGEKLAPEIDDAFDMQPVVLVPLPGSRCTSAAIVKASRVTQVARIAASYTYAGTPVRELLCWSQIMQPSHEGGPRDPSILARHLVVEPGVPDPNIEVALIDDVLTTGGHFRAAAARLRRAGWKVAEVAFAVARTVWVTPDASRSPVETFKVMSEELEPFEWSPH